MTRYVILAYSLMFLAFGLWSLTDPIAMTSSLGVEVGGPSGTFEMRGIFGGVNLGIGLLMAAAVFKRDLERPALWAMLAYFGGYTIGRASSWVAGDSAELANWGFAGFELASLVITAFLLRARQSA